MDYEFAMKWADALESDEYKQITGCLFDGTGFCCFGVAEAVAGSKFDVIINRCGQANYFVRGAGNSAIISEETRTKIGMRSNMGNLCDYSLIEVGGLDYENLLQANNSGRTFREIGAAIRKNWEIL